MDKKIKGSFPLTILNAKIIDLKRVKTRNGISAKAYQNNNLNNQQFYKPISKILKF